MFGEPLYDATLRFTKVTEYGLSLAAFGRLPVARWFPNCLP